MSPRPSAVRRVGLASLIATTVLTAAMLAGTVATSATFNDSARLGLGSHGIGSADPFAIVLVDDAGTAQEAEPGAPLALDLPDRDTLVPGRTLEASARVANNHPDIAAAVAATVDAEPVAGTPDLTPFLRITVLGPEGEVLLGAGADRPQDGVDPGALADLGVLTARGAAPVPHGTAWTEGAAGSATSLTVLVHLLDDPATSALNGGQAHLSIRIDATSTEAPA